MLQGASPNKRQKDAPHFYISWSLHPDSAPWSECRTSIVPNRDDFLPRDVMRHRFAPTKNWTVICSV